MLCISLEAIKSEYNFKCIIASPLLTHFIFLLF